MKQVLLIIDPQQSFMDNPAGSLAVPGATEDMQKLSYQISSAPNEFDSIVVTLDTHYKYHIAHSAYWVDSDGNPVSEFTQITLEDFEAGKYKTVDPSKMQWAHTYLTKLKEGNRYTLMIWPDHCIVNTQGYLVQPDLMSALQEWEKTTGKTVKYVKKGMNPDTESYSVFKAEVPVEGVLDTYMKTDLLKYLDGFEKISVAGEALSHCVASSVDDLMTYVNPTKVTITPYCSAVSGFEQQGEAFLNRVEQMGGNVHRKRAKLKV